MSIRQEQEGEPALRSSDVLTAGSCPSDNRDVSQLTGHLANQTAEWRQLLTRHQNLVHERDHLNVSLETAEVKLDRLRKNSGEQEVSPLGFKVCDGEDNLGHVSVSSVACPDGWRRLGCRCFLLSSTRDTWESGRRQCSGLGADLVIVNSREEMVRFSQTSKRFNVSLRFSLRSIKWF